MILELINDAVYSLLSKNVDRSEIMVCYSEIIGRIIDEEIYSTHCALIDKRPPYKDIRYNGFTLRNDWPFNNIVVYTPKCCYYPELLVVIEVDKIVVDKHFVKPSERK